MRRMDDPFDSDHPPRPWQVQSQDDDVDVTTSQGVVVVDGTSRAPELELGGRGEQVYKTPLEDRTALDHHHVRAGRAARLGGPTCHGHKRQPLPPATISCDAS